MSQNINDIVLRPRFKFEVGIDSETLLSKFEMYSKKDFVISRVDEHVFIRFPKHMQQYWSPQLHLEIHPKDTALATVKGLFGPNPTVWTMFMFLHFVVAGLFIVFGIWTYTNFSLKQSFAIPLFLCLFMVVVWLLLYSIGRMGKTKGADEMHKLHEFMKTVINA